MNSTKRNAKQRKLKHAKSDAKNGEQPDKRKRGGQPGNKNAAKPHRKPTVLISARVSPDVANIADEMCLTDAELIEVLADCTALLARRAFQVEDGAWYAVWVDAHGAEYETDHSALTEREARITAGVEHMLYLRRVNDEGKTRHDEQSRTQTSERALNGVAERQ